MRPNHILQSTTMTNITMKEHDTSDHSKRQTGCFSLCHPQTLGIHSIPLHTIISIVQRCSSP